MVSVMITAIIGGLVLAGIVFGFGYFFYVMSKPKKVTWNARLYTLSDGIRPPLVDKKGKIISDIKLKDLRPFSTDVVEKLHKGKGITVYFLQREKITVPPITNDVVEKWGKFNEVNILLDKGNCTILKKGYDSETGNEIYTPLPYETLSMIDNQIAIREEKYQTKTKDLLAALAPYFLGILVFIALIANGYFMADMFTKTSADRVEIAKEFARSSDVMANKLGEISSIIDNEKVKQALQIKEEQPPEEDYVE